MGLMKDLDGLNAAYASMQEGSGPMTLTKADKVGNTPAWRNRHKKNVKSGEPLYKMADHLKDEYESELWNTVSKNLTELHELGGVQFKVVPLNEKEKYKTVAAVIDYDRSKKGTDDATYDSEHGEKKKAKKERDYAEWEREKMKKDDPNWKHKKGSTSEEVEALASSGKFTVEEIAKIAGIEIDEAQTAYEKARKAAARRAADRNAARRRGEMGGRMERETYTNEAGKRMHYKGYTARDGE